jgi:hypothetical protein
MTRPTFDDATPLGLAQKWLRERAAGEGAKCPCCSQFTRVYRRGIGAPMAHGLIRAYRAAGLEWFHMPTVLNRIAGDHAKLRYWGLIEEDEQAVANGGRTAGVWRVTELGERFVQCLESVPRYALIYDGRLLRLDKSQGYVTIRTALGTKFDYDELMGTPALVAPPIGEA